MANFVDKYKECLRRMQPIESDLCGQYCLYYALEKCNGFSMEEFIRNIPYLLWNL